MREQNTTNPQTDTKITQRRLETHFRTGDVDSSTDPCPNSSSSRTTCPGRAADHSPARANCTLATSSMTWSIPPSIPQRRQYPQLIAIALLLRHSWFPEDLADTAVWLGLTSTLLTESALTSSLHSSSRRSQRRQALRLRRGAACTPQKGDPTC